MKPPSDKLSLLFAASEAAPFAKEGGLGDVVGSLPKYLARLGHDVRVVIPRYYSVNLEKYGLRLLTGTLVVPMGIIGRMYCGVYEGRLPGSDVPIYFLEHEQFYGRAGLYQQDGQGYLDNDNRFVFLSKAALELCKMLNFHPDVIHAHDWHTGIIPALLNTSYLHDRYVGESASLLTLHNMQHQGNFYPGLMEVLGIGLQHIDLSGLQCLAHLHLGCQTEFSGKIYRIRRTDLFHDLDTDNVDGIGQCLAHGHRTSEGIIIVFGLPGFSGPIRIFHLGIVDDRGGRQTFFQGRRIDDRLEGRTGIPFGLDGAVELALAEIIAADHGLDPPAARIDGHQGCLDIRGLVKCELGPGLVDIGRYNRDIND